MSESSQSVVIAPYRSAWQASVVELIVAIQRDEFGFDITADDQPDLLDIESFYQSGGGGFWVATIGHDVVGTIGLRDIGQGRGALRKMFVKAAHRGSELGVAARLLDELLSHMRASGMTEIFLGTTDRFRAAHRFYEKNGFALIPAVKLPETFPRMKVDTRFYRLKLTS